MSNPTPQQVVAARKRLGLTQTGLGALLHMSRPTIARLESGEYTLSPPLWAYLQHRAGIKEIPFASKPTIRR